MPMRNHQREWIFPELLEIPVNFQDTIGGSSVVSQTLFRRGFQTVDSARGFMDPDFYQPSSPSQLPGLDTAVDRIQDALTNKQNILVWGDFDVDGQTSTTLLVSGLSGLGSEVYHYIPNRARESHGLSADVLLKKITYYKPAVLLTCDTGIDAVESVSVAQSAGVDVIITDHHQLPHDLPKAHSIVNPNMLQKDHPLFSLPGVGVAYKLIESLYGRLNKNPESLLDLVALGIVADVARQTADTRYLLQEGLKQLRVSSRLGIQQLCEITNTNQADITEDQIGFVIGPRVNALGRLDDANTCVEFFTTTDLDRASGLANQLDQLNAQRQHLTESIFQDSLKMLEEFPEFAHDYPVIVLQGPAQWHPGVIGIVASRIVERFHKPVIMLSKEGKIARGSARSIPGVPISELISKASGLLNSFGGHPMAAGVSLPLDNVTAFRRSLSENYGFIVGGPPEPPQIVIDAELPFQSISPSFIKGFQRMAPFGSGNPKLLFATRGVEINPHGTKIIGKKSNHKKITLSDSSGTSMDLLWWNSVDIELPIGSFDVAYSLDLATYKKQLQVQAVLRHFRESPGTPVLIKEKSKIELLDFRKIPEPEKELSILLSSPGTIVWSELISPNVSTSVRRLDLSTSKTLVVWTTPPSREVFHFALKRVDPRRIAFFAIDPEVQSLQDLIAKLHGLLKHYMGSDSAPYDPDKFAQSIAVTPAIIMAGLEWIHLHGDYDLSSFSSNGEIKRGTRNSLEGFPVIDRKLKSLLKELVAYRSYFNSKKLETLL